MKKLMFDISREVFQVTLVGYLILVIVESFRAGAVSNFFSMTIFLGVVVASGIAMATLEPKHETKVEKMESSRLNEGNIFYTIMLSMIGGFLVYAKTASLGTVGYLVSALAAVIIFLLSILIISEDGNV